MIEKLNQNNKIQSSANIFHNKGNIFQNNRVSSKNIFSPKKQFQNQCGTNNITPKSSIQCALSSLTFPCCGQNMINSQANRSENNLITDLYLMPCGHNMCYKCICTILQFKTDNTISCSNPECTKIYAKEEAETMFIKNSLVKSFLESVINLKCLINKQKMLKGRQLLKNKSCKGLFNGNSHKIHFEQKDIQIDEKRQDSSAKSSQQQIFNPCLNIFCKKPTIQLFCSYKCQVFVDQLQKEIPYNLYRIKDN